MIQVYTRPIGNFLKLQKRPTNQLQLTHLKKSNLEPSVPSRRSTSAPVHLIYSFVSYLGKAFYLFFVQPFFNQLSHLFSLYHSKLSFSPDSKSCLGIKLRSRLALEISHAQFSAVSSLNLSGYITGVFLEFLYRY